MLHAHRRAAWPRLSAAGVRPVRQVLQARPVTLPAASGHDGATAYSNKGLIVEGAAEGPLAKLTFAVKDIFDIQGQRCGFGNPAWQASHPPASSHAPAVAACLAAGGVLKGVTIMDELAYSLAGENVHYGTPPNPAAPGRIPGGSSSGSASVVAAGDVDFALGSDTGGSVRVPASYCGILGWRPTWGRISLEGVRPLAPSFDTVGVFARSSAVLQRAAAALLAASSSGYDQAAAAAPATRWLVAADAFALCEPGTAAALYQPLSAAFPQVSRILGSAPEEMQVAAGLAPQGLGTLHDWWAQSFRVKQAGEAWEALGPWISAHEPRFGANIGERFNMASRVSPEQRQEAAAKQAVIREHVLQLLAPGTVLVLPSAPGPAPPLGYDQSPAGDEWRARALSICCIAGLCGLPQVSLPLATVDGLPVGLSLVGRPGADEQLLAVADQLMRLLQPAAGQGR